MYKDIIYIRDKTKSEFVKNEILGSVLLTFCLVCQRKCGDSACRRQFCFPPHT